MKKVEKPLVSVIIPTYNRANVIHRSISSAIKQSYQKIEIIIVDDASTDDTSQIIQQINDTRIIYICHQINLGGSEARNTGIKNAQGKFIAFLDSDDVWLPDKLQHQLAIISQHKCQDNLVCYTQFQKSSQIFYQRSILPAKSKQEQETTPEYFWLSGGEMLTSTLLVSRILASRTLFQTGLIKHQDLDFVIRLEKQGAKFIFVPQVLVIWHNEQRCDRISCQVNYQASLDWIQQYRQHISDDAYQGFLLKEIVPKMIKEPANQSIATNLIFQAWRKGIISPFYGLYLLLKSSIPHNYQQQIKKIIKPN
ncbi:glycosyltransferase family 2 protein [Pleurocapsa sp. FMAR1]|uniref:glycosyltransferase family 2 protein n=1 Tax=Pleurocapsa sp. FMAR1 TaxID=3040204 RepID=UPI0029C7BC8D|nr:glycosyltransferase family 2 protein [Pleurocapsa sp. FMAR1]